MKYLLSVFLILNPLNGVAADNSFQEVQNLRDIFSGQKVKQGDPGLTQHSGGGKVPMNGSSLSPRRSSSPEYDPLGFFDETQNPGTSPGRRPGGPPVVQDQIN